MTRMVLLAVLLISLPLAASAKDERGRYVSMGEGNANCGTYLGAYSVADLRKRGSDHSYRGDFGSYLNWLQGYASRVNQTEPGGQNVYQMGTVDIAGWVASWCRDNPSKSLLEAMDQLTNKVLGSH